MTPVDGCIDREMELEPDQSRFASQPTTPNSKVLGLLSGRERVEAKPQLWMIRLEDA